MKFDIEKIPYIPFKWMQKRVFDWEYIASKHSPQEDVYIKIARDRHYFLSCKRLPNNVTEYHFETRLCLGEFVDTFEKIPENLSKKDKMYPLCQSETQVEYLEVFINSQFSLSASREKTSVKVPALFKVKIADGIIKSFLVENFVYDGQKKITHHSDLYLAPRSSLSPLDAIKCNIREYDPSFSGIQRVQGTNKSLTISSYEMEKIAKRDSHFKRKERCFYNSFVSDLLHFDLEDHRSADSSLCAKMMSDIENIKKMDSRYCSQGSAFLSFHDRWTSLFNIKTPKSYWLD